MTNHEAGLIGWIRARLGSPQGKVIITISLVVLAVVVLGLLRQLSADTPGGDAPEPRRSLSFNTGPATGSPGPLPTATEDRNRDSIVGDLPNTGAQPGESTALESTRIVLAHYCPGIRSTGTKIREISGFDVIEITVELLTRPVTLLLRWTGTSYRWQGSYKALNSCS
jgi:hypothetical protein